MLRRKEAAHPGGVTDLAFSTDGSLLASCGRDGRLLVHSLDTNEAGDQTSLLFEHGSQITDHRLQNLHETPSG